jgi:hypothetical protein
MLTPAAYASGMSLDIGDAAAAAAAGARDALTAASATVNERTMGAVARQALFAEALLGAVKAHVNELKLVAK